MSDAIRYFDSTPIRKPLVEGTLRSQRAKPLDQMSGTLLRTSLEVNGHFLQQMLSGTDPVSFGSQVLSRHGLTEFDPKLPAAFFHDATGNQFCLVTRGESDRSGGHLEEPTVMNRHAQLFAKLAVNRKQQGIPGGEELAGLPQLVEEKQDGILYEGGKLIAKAPESSIGP